MTQKIEFWCWLLISTGTKINFQKEKTLESRSRHVGSRSEPSSLACTVAALEKPAPVLPWRSSCSRRLGGASYLYQFGKTMVPAKGCAYFGQPTPLACPLRQAWGNPSCVNRGRVFPPPPYVVTEHNGGAMHSGGATRHLLGPTSWLDAMMRLLLLHGQKLTQRRDRGGGRQQVRERRMLWKR
jgi:hypothetical protein